VPESSFAFFIFSCPPVHHVNIQNFFQVFLKIAHIVVSQHIVPLYMPIVTIIEVEKVHIHHGSHFEQEGDHPCTEYRCTRLPWFENLLGMLGKAYPSTATWRFLGSKRTRSDGLSRKQFPYVDDTPISQYHSRDLC
jgi:hypothetical protein